MNQSINARFSLAVMSSNYAEKILGALASVDTTSLQRTARDIFSSTYIGTPRHVLHAMKSLFIHVNDHDTHITLEGTLSPASSSFDTTAPQILAPLSEVKFNLYAKVTLYAEITTADTWDTYKALLEDLAKNEKIHLQTTHLTVELYGNVHQIFNLFNAVIASPSVSSLANYALQFTLSVNSPSMKKMEHLNE